MAGKTQLTTAAGTPAGNNQNSRTDAEGAEAVGTDRESHQADLFGSIENGDCPKRRLCIQVMRAAEAEKPRINPFGLMKVWPHGEYQLIEARTVDLNRTPENYFADVEQSSFSRANQVREMSHSPDKMLQFRIFSCADAYRYRLGVNYETLAVNQARCLVHSFHLDGAMPHDGNTGGALSYEPNSCGGPTEDHRYVEPLKVDGDAYHRDHRDGNDDYRYPGDLFRPMMAEEQDRLIGNLVRAMKSVPREIQLRQVGHFPKADPAYGEGVAQDLGIDVTELEGAAAAA